MEFETQPLEVQMKKPLTPMQTGKPQGDAAFEVASTLEMFNLPNRSPLTPEVVKKIAEQLKKQYDIAVLQDAIKAEITALLNASSGHYQKAQDILDKAPKEAAPKLAEKLRYLP
jgi:uncharacterized protein YpuA (DUF1002 family)